MCDSEKKQVDIPRDGEQSLAEPPSEESNPGRMMVSSEKPEFTTTFSERVGYGF